MSKSGNSDLGFPGDLSDLVASPSNPEFSQAYISAVLGVSASDAKNYTATATLEFAAIVFLAKDSVEAIRTAGTPLQIAAVVSLVGLAISAASFFIYALEINSRRMAIARTLVSNDPRHARQLWATKDKRGGEYQFGLPYRLARAIGYGGLTVGSIALATTVIGLYF